MSTFICCATALHGLIFFCLCCLFHVCFNPCCNRICLLMNWS